MTDNLPYHHSLRYRTKLASLLLEENGVKTSYVYYQAQSGHIWETYRADGASSWTEYNLVYGANVMMGTPLAAISWKDKSGGRWKRVFYINNNFFVSDMLFKPGASEWSHGVLRDQKYLATSQSGLSACTYYDATQQWQYTCIQYEDEKNWKIQEIRDAGSWDNSSGVTAGREFWTEPIHGTSLAYVNRGTETAPKMHVVYQDMQGSLKDVYWPGSGPWDDGKLLLPITKTSYQTPLAACGAVIPGRGSYLHLFYYNEEKGGICHRWYTEGYSAATNATNGQLDGWCGDNDEEFVVKNAVVGAGISASCVYDANLQQIDMRLFFITKHNVMAEIKAEAPADTPFWNPFDYDTSIIPCGTWHYMKGDNSKVATNSGH